MVWQCLPELRVKIPLIQYWPRQARTKAACLAQTDFGNLQNTALGERGENTDGMRPEEEEPEGIDMGPGRATRGRRQRR